MAGQNSKGMKNSFKLVFKRILRMTGLLLIVLFVSCKTVPQIPDAFLQEIKVLPLDEGASVYIIADVKHGRSIIDLLPLAELKDKQTARMIEKTDFLIAAMFPQESGRRFQAVTWGNYPSFRAKMAFGFNRNWKKQKSKEGAFWYSKANNLSLSLSSKQAFVVSSVSSVPVNPAPSAPGVEIPKELGDFNRGAPISCWLEDPAPMFDQMLSRLPIRFPVQGLFLCLYSKGNNQYEAEIRLQFGNASQALGAAAILALASGLVDNSASSFFSVFLINQPVTNGRNLDIKTNLMNEKEISLLFEMFLLYLE